MVYKLFDNKSASGGGVKNKNIKKLKICQTNNKLKNYTNQSLESLKNEKFTHRLKITFGV